MALTPIVVVFLRGGADALTLVPPCGDDHYRVLRPTLAVAKPIDLDGHFGLNPKLAPLMAAFANKELLIVHACGTDDRSRSHFEAQDRMEQGGPTGQGMSSGWLARTLRAGGAEAEVGLSAVAIGAMVPEALRGAPSATALTSVASFRVGGGGHDAFTSALRSLYVEANDAAEPVRVAGRATLAVLDRLGASSRLPSPNAGLYPAGELGDALRQVAELVRADCGLRAACVDHGGWDSHFAQTELIGDRMEELGAAMAAFRADLAASGKAATLVVMTEFGRRAYENGSLGTDHGRAGAMFLLGPTVAGGRVLADWPGLSDSDLEEPGDLRVTIDYRDVLSELVRAPEVFPGYVPRKIGAFREAS